MGGFYLVHEAAGLQAGANAGAGADTGAGAGARATGALWECRLRGRFRREGQDVLAGDIVAFDVVDAAGYKGVVEEVLPRKNRLLRPPSANVDQALIVLAADTPPPDLWLLDRLLLMLLAEGIRPLLCWNKEDLAGPGDLEGLQAPYAAAGFAQATTCALDGSGADRLAVELAGRMSVLAGPSGVGKSSLLNMIDPRLALKTGEISQKLGRGKHTTRHVEWIPLAGGGWVADTPGFSQIVLPAALTPEALAKYYPDFEPFVAQCRFRSCLHDQDRDCGVSAAVREGSLDGGRYRRYLTFLREAAEQNRKAKT